MALGNFNLYEVGIIAREARVVIITSEARVVKSIMTYVASFYNYRMVIVTIIRKFGSYNLEGEC